jgi:uncharacterized protein YndB with AHSA1/START domain
VDPVTTSVTIARPREEVFAYLSDMANHAEFTDHYLVDWRLTREDSVGYGAGARFRVKAPFARFAHADATLVELQEPHLIVERGRSGKFNRVLTRGVYELNADGDHSTRVRFTFETKPKFFSDRLQEMLGGSWWLRRKMARGLERLRDILEDGQGRGARPTISGGARKPASAHTFSGLAKR